MAAAAVAFPSAPGRAKKRNVKALKLADESPSAPSLNINAVPPNKRRLLDENSSPHFLTSPLKVRITPTLNKFRAGGPDRVLLGLTPDSARPTRSALHASLTTKLASLDMNAGERKANFWETIQGADLRVLHELGAGSSASVVKVEHIPTGKVMARKNVMVDANPTTRKQQLLLEIHISHSCASPYLVSSYGAYLDPPSLCICMEFMDKGSFDQIYKRLGKIPIGVLAHVANAVLCGLQYLLDEHNVLHRDVKPSNILCNSDGQIKLCDFGVCCELEEASKTNTSFEGTSVYMAPERIQALAYSIKSDVWSLGISLIELAHGRFPFAESSHSASPSLDKLRDRRGLLTPRTPRSGLPSAAAETPISSVDQMCIIELMHQIVAEPPPKLSPSQFTVDAQDFVRSCLEKDVDMRLAPEDLLQNPWLECMMAETDIKTWAETL